MNEDEIVQLKAQVRAIEMAVIVNMMIDAANDGTTDIHTFGQGRQSVLNAVAEIAGSDPDPNPALAEALTKFGERLATLSAGFAKDWAATMSAKATDRPA